MNYMRNPELRHTLFLYVFLTAVLSGIGFINSTLCGVMLLVSGALFTAIFLFVTYRRYKAIMSLSSNIDRVLHGQDKIFFSESKEGELAILGSEIHKMTVRLKEQADVLKSDKLNLTDAIADISHQLRTPLTSMNLTVSLLSSDELSEEKRIALTHELKKSLRRIDWLIEALLKISKIDAGTVKFKSEKVSVGELTDKAAAPFVIPMELKEQQLDITVDDESYTGDLQWSVEAVGNVLKNCIEHTPNGGRVGIIARETAIFTEIVIKDSGAGFEKDELPHLFERFYKGRNSDASSVGIGLALSKMIITSQNGTITAKNGKNGGAEFIIRFYKGVI